MSHWATVFLFGFAFATSASGLLELMTPLASLLGWAALAGAGVTTTTGYVLFFIGAGIIGVTRAVVWSVTEPLFAIAFAILLVGEWLTPLQWIGVALVILGLLRFESASMG